MMRLLLPSTDDERRIHMEHVLLAARPEHGTPLVHVNDATLNNIRHAHDSLVSLLADQAALDKRINITQERVNAGMPKVRNMLTTYWGAMRSLQKQNFRVIDFQSVYGFQNLAVSKLRDLDAVRSLDRILGGLNQLAQANPPKSQDQDQEQNAASAKLAVNVPVIGLFDIQEVEAALEGLEDDLLFLQEVRSQRKARTATKASCRQRIQLLLRQLAGHIRLESLEDSRIDTREKLRAFGFRFNSDKPTSEASAEDTSTTSEDDLLADALQSQG